MKKTMSFLTKVLSSVLTLGMLTACGSGTAPTSSTPAGSAGGSSNEPAQQQVDVTFWTHYSDDIAFTKKKVEDFNAQYAGKIRVELKHVADDYNNVLLLALKNGTGPDIYADGIELKQLIDQNYVAPLDGLMSPEMLERAQDKKQLGNNWAEGKWYSLPFRGYNFRLAWNKDLFAAAGLDPEAPPKTYAELLDAAKKITEYGKTQTPQKFGFMLPTGEEWIWWIYASQMARVNGDSYYDYATGRYDYEAYRPVMELYLQMQKDGSLFPGGTTMQNDPARAQFSAGNVGMIIAASWDIGVFNDQFPAQCQWDVATLPNEDGTLQGYSQMDAGSYLLINGASDPVHQQAAMEFYEYLLSEETLIEYYEGGYGVPVYDGIADRVTEQPDRPGFAGFADVTLDRMYPIEAPVQLEGDGSGKVLNDILSGSVDMGSAFADLNKRYNAALDKGVAEGEFKLEDYTNKSYSTLNPSGE